MIKGRKVKIVNRTPPYNKKVGEVIHAFKDHNGLWLTIVQYDDRERFIAIEGIDKLKPVVDKDTLKILEEY